MSTQASAEPAKKRRGRPPKASRPDIDTRALLIRSGVEVLTAQGFSSAGLDLILKRVGIPKGSFYYFFPSKEAFGQEVLQSYHRFFVHKLDKHLLNQELTPLARIREFCTDANQGMQRHDWQRGCLVGNLGQEVELLPESFRPKLLEIFGIWQQKIENCLILSVQQGEIPKDTNCSAMAEFFWIGWEGAVMRARLQQSPQPLTHFLQQFLHCLNQPMGNRTT
ncbi:TetR family transcriptional regulator [Aestuariirhabdus litorea]|uniref:TetR family transcriptional regulator n=2 Tax=Aestuariirhabdus litorea TaxID=2528527 RepID=A0A3P3VQJ6_9GAMM|nr:TetR family transcriptional regulator [Aestuariirhabdus litorea]RWW98689.1 TetR family transcriptional regulator [Endozoicomonadaceae bacterium GTF-13]